MLFMPTFNLGPCACCGGVSTCCPGRADTDLPTTIYITFGTGSATSGTPGVYCAMLNGQTFAAVRDFTETAITWFTAKVCRSDPGGFGAVNCYRIGEPDGSPSSYLPGLTRGIQLGCDETTGKITVSARGQSNLFASNCSFNCLPTSGGVIEVTRMFTSTTNTGHSCNPILQTGTLTITNVSTGSVEATIPFTVHETP